MSETLPIGLSSWIIQDGNYSDFEVGQTRAFALEFFAQVPLKRVDAAKAGAPRHAYKGDAQFEVLGKSIHVGDDWWVADFGIPAYSSRWGTALPKPNIFVEGSAYIGVDHFDYFERLAHTVNAPPLIFDWRVERIQIQTAPFIERSPRTFVRDPEKMGWRDIGATNAWEDDDGRAEYILHCVRLTEQPRRQLNK
jgi:hypothetical protein